MMLPGTAWTFLGLNDTRRGIEMEKKERPLARLREYASWGTETLDFGQSVFRPMDGLWLPLTKA